MHYKRKAETTLSLCGDASANFTCDIQYVTCLSCSKLQDDWLNPNLHTFEIDPKVAGCARCGQSAIAHASVPEDTTRLLQLADKSFEKDAINPQHYKSLPNGLECIEVTQWFNFNLGNAIKYCWRAGKKSPDPVQDLQKAIRYLEFEIERIKNNGSKS